MANAEFMTNEPETQTVAKKPKTKKDAIIHDLEYMRAQDAELVTGVFKDYECKGGILEFVYKKYRQDKVQKYILEDGVVYKIPLGVAKHITNNCWTPVHHNILDSRGNPTVEIQKKNRRFAFQSLDFIDYENKESGGQMIVKMDNMAIRV